MFDFKIEAPTGSSAERSVVLVVSPFVFLMIGQVARWAAEVINENTNTVIRLVVFLMCVFPCYVIV